jgi:ATP-dependent protease ClpP protease subunit
VTTPGNPIVAANVMRPAQPQVPPNAAIYVTFSGEINAHTTESLIAAMANCANARAREVHLLMSTPGGAVMNGINLYNVLRGMPFKLVTHNVGNVDSIGNAIFLAGEERYACPHSTFMFRRRGARQPQRRGGHPPADPA